MKNEGKEQWATSFESPSILTEVHAEAADTTFYRFITLVLRLWRINQQYLEDRRFCAMLLSFLISRALVVCLSVVNNIDTVKSFTTPLAKVQHQQHIHNRLVLSHWRHSGHDRCSLQTRYESKNNVFDDIWSEGDNPTDLETGYFGDEDEEDSVSETSKLILAGGTLAVLVAAGALAVTMRNDLGLDLEFSQLVKDPSNSFDTILAALGTMDPQKGMIYFSSFYVLAEILAIPAVS